MAKYSTTLYVANSALLDKPIRQALREEIYKTLAKLADEQGLTTLPNYKSIVYDSTQVGFRIRDLKDDNLLLLTFFPYGKDSNKWFGSRNKKASEDTVKFCGLIGDNFTINCSDKTFKFKRKHIEENENIDISDWEVKFPQKNPAEKSLLSDFQSNHYNKIFNSVPSDNKFYIFTESFIENKPPATDIINSLKKCLGVYGKIEGPISMANAKEFAHTVSDKDTSSFIFVESDHLIKKWKDILKNYFDTHHIPSQYISDKTISEKLGRWPGVKANLLLEIMAKRGRNVINLKPKESFMSTEGFLCLSDIESTRKKLFGVLFEYTTEQTETEETVQIYDDIEFESGIYSLKISKSDHIRLLVERISKLINKELCIDLILTKEWRESDLTQFIQLLSEKGIKINRAYHISSKTARFTDSFITSYDIKKNKHLYTFVGDKVAFLRTSTEIRIYPSLSQLFINLYWPREGKIELLDLEKILWLVKKRIYRLQEFHVLKIPEPMYIFRILGDLYIPKVDHILTLPLRLLI